MKKLPLRVDVQEYLASYDIPLVELALKIRKKILDIDADLDEEIKWNNLTYRKKRPLFGIVIHKNHINLEFWQGTLLNDPDNLMEGTGKKIRHYKIRNEEDINIPMEDFIKQAIFLDSKP